MASERLQIPIDKAGRVVLPKGIRDRLGLNAGTEFEVIEEPDRIILKPVPDRPKIIKENGWLKVEFKELPKETIRETIERIREERNKRVGGY
ncbi:MAG: AbrB/MazE/SpoVT family DNA-binding domain-containing protein [Deltaproteobacteria bacterium]|nr:AbrB/MazE/SpoVT family DNA-binding domain-containing protein [Deltaproteobacteria bacterium]